MKVANPFYDIVFKYMMEDERITRTILSTLLQVDVLAVEDRPHDNSDDTHNNLSVISIDFGTTIRDAVRQAHYKCLYSKRDGGFLTNCRMSEILPHLTMCHETTK